MSDKKDVCESAWLQGMVRAYPEEILLRSKKLGPLVKRCVVESGTEKEEEAAEE